MDIDVPEVIECVDCGQRAHRLTPPPEEGWQSGDLVAYRCSGCNDRWDLEVAEPPPDGGGATAGEFDLRAWLADRRSS